MPKHNNIVPVSKFKKDWKVRVRVNFDQPMKAKARKAARLHKAATSFPRPIDKLRPIVHLPGRINYRVREGRGFTAAELQAAGIRSVQFARTIGIAVDTRRENKCQESIDTNAARLKDYLARLVLFPQKAGKPKKSQFASIADATPETLEKLQSRDASLRSLETAFPVTSKKPTVEFVDITDADRKAMKAFLKIRRARQAQHRVGYMHKKKKQAEADAQAQGSKRK